MPRTVSSLQEQVTAAKPVALNRAILATEIMREHWFPAQPADNRPAEAKEFEKEMWEHGADRLFTRLASKVFVTELRNTPPSSIAFTPPFLSVFVPVKSWRLENTKDDNWNGLKYGVAYIATSPKGRNIFRDAEGNKVTMDEKFYTAHVRPATPEEVENVVNGLFAVRPALTVDLFSTDEKGD